MMQYIGLSYDIFNFYGGVAISKVTDKNLWMRSYEIWGHANDLIEASEEEFFLSDGITNLKRSLNHRLQLIEKMYQFKKIDFANKPKGYLELLETYGLVRPYIMKELLKIRNGIEHYDEEPPNKLRCRELSDAVWYFLKSTDNIVQIMKYVIEFIIIDECGEETGFRYTMQLDWDRHHNLKIEGLLPMEYISQGSNEKFIKVEKLEGKILYKSKGDNGGIVNGKILLSKEDYHLLLKDILMYAS